MNIVILNKKAQKQIKKLPAYITSKLLIWAATVECDGIMETRKLSGYHDELLKGQRTGQRSIRLSKAYRAIYVEHDENIVIEVIEVNKHDY